MPSPFGGEGTAPERTELRNAGSVEVVLGAPGGGRHLGQRFLLGDDVHGRAGLAVCGDHRSPVARADQPEGLSGRAARGVAGPPDPRLSV